MNLPFKFSAESNFICSKSLIVTIGSKEILFYTIGDIIPPIWSLVFFGLQTLNKKRHKGIQINLFIIQIVIEVKVRKTWFTPKHKIYI